MFQTTNQLIYVIRYYHSMVFSSDHNLVQLMLKENHEVIVWMHAFKHLEESNSKHSPNQQQHLSSMEQNVIYQYHLDHQLQ